MTINREETIEELKNVVIEIAHGDQNIDILEEIEDKEIEELYDKIKTASKITR